MKLLEMDARLCLSYMKKLDQQSLIFQNDVIDLLAMSLFFSSCNKIVFFKLISITHNIAFTRRSQFIIDHVWKFFQRYWPKFLKKKTEGFFIKEMEAKILLSMFLIKNDISFLTTSLSYYKQADNLIIPVSPYMLAFRNYHFYKGRAFFEKYKNFAITTDIIEAVESLKKAYTHGGQNSPEICCLYAEVLTQFSDYLGEIEPLDLAITCASKAIFLTSRATSYSLKEYEIFWIIYVLTLKKRFELTHTFEDFNNLLKSLDQAHQEVKNASYFSIIFGEVAILYGSMFNNVYWVELGLSKINFLVNKQKSFFRVLSLFIRGISNLGLLIENISLIQEGRSKVVSNLKYVSNNVNLLNSFGENYYCLGMYFEEKKFFFQAIYYFKLALKLSPKDSLLRFNLAKSYLEQGQLFKDLEAISFSEELFFELYLSYPRSVLYCYYLSKVLFFKAKNFQKEKKSLCYLKLSLEKIEKVLEIEKNYNYLFLKSKILFSLEVQLNNTFYIKKCIEILEELYQENNKNILFLKFFIEALFYLYNLDKNKNYLFKINKLSKIILSVNLEDDQAHLYQGKALLFLFDCCMEEVFYCCSWKDLSKISLVQSISLGNKEAHYWLACLYALESSVDRALFYLKQSLINGFSLSREKLKNDIYFSKIKDNKEFSDFLFNLI